MPRYLLGVWDSILQELWYTPSRRDLLVKALRQAGEPMKILAWKDFKAVAVACINGMYGRDSIPPANRERYTPEALENNSSDWQSLHRDLSTEVKRQVDVEAAEKARLDACKQEPGGGILVDGSEASMVLAQKLLGLDEENAKLAVGVVKFTGQVRPTFLKGRKTWHTTRDDLDGQGAKDAKRTGKKKITFFYDQCNVGCVPGDYLVGWGVHTGKRQYQLVAMVTPVDRRLQSMCQWGPKTPIHCGTEKE